VQSPDSETAGSSAAAVQRLGTMLVETVALLENLHTCEGTGLSMTVDDASVAFFKKGCDLKKEIALVTKVHSAPCLLDSAACLLCLLEVVRLRLHSSATK
jgi:hypothetical protein